jgi:hypothetical protein
LLPESVEQYIHKYGLYREWDKWLR